MARRIAARVPDARIIAVLREPVDRAYSKYRQMRRDSAEPIADFGAAVRLEEHRRQPGWSPAWLYLDRGFYHRQLRAYYDAFPASQIHVLLYEDLCRNPKRVPRNIFRFLGVDTDLVVDVRKRHNVSADPQVPRAAWLYDLVLRPFLLSPHLQSALPERVVARVRPWARSLLLKRAQSTQPAPLAPDLRAMLTTRFREDVEQLQRLIGRDLSHWLAPCRAAARWERPFAGEGRMVGVGG
ncbi:MAG TPA: sulfotransferase [Geminicoccaceae bacterium]|nr:sulfotransferase [Geminicoccaceae bacterium]